MIIKKINRNLKSKIILNIIMMVVMLFYLLPLWYVFNNAFKKAKFISITPFTISSKSFTFQNIIDSFRLMKYPMSFINSFIIVFFSCVFLIILGSLAAYGISCVGNRFTNNIYIFFVALISVPFQIAMVPLVIMLKNIGLADSYLGICLVYSAMYLPFVIFLYTGFMRTIPKEMMESAKLDGCNAFKTYLYIYMPLLKTITGIVLIIRGTSIWNDLLIPLILINRPSMFTLQLKLYTFTQSRIGALDMVFGGTLIVCLPLVIFFLLMQKSFIKGVMAGSVKG